MENTCSMNLDKWRDYFNVPGSDIFDIINHAIMVAMADFPIDFKQKRDQIAEKLFSCTKIKCPGREKTEFPSSCVEIIDGKLKGGVGIGGSNDTKESKVNENDGNVDYGLIVTDNVNIDEDRNFSHEDAEALIRCEEKNDREEVLRIKEILDNEEKEADIVIYELLKSLKRKSLTYQTLVATKIGKTVNALRNHGSKDVRNLVRALVKDWKTKADNESYQTKEAIAVVAKKPEKTPGFEEEYHGLHIPPMDDIYLNDMTIDPTLFDYSEFLNDTDDLGNLFEDVPKNFEFSKNQVNAIPENPNIPIQKLDSNKDSHTSTCPKNKMEQKIHKIKQNQQLKRSMRPSCESIPTRPTSVVQQPKPPSHESIPRIPSRSKLVVQRKPSRRESTLGRQKPVESISARPVPVLQPQSTRRECIPSRPKHVVQTQPPRREYRPKPVIQPNIDNEIRVQRITDRDVIQNKSMKPQQHANIPRKKNLNGTIDEVSMRDKLETAKRKLQERYQEVDNAKKQKTIKVVEFKDVNKHRKPNINRVRNLKRDLSNVRQ